MLKDGKGKVLPRRFPEQKLKRISVATESEEESDKIDYVKRIYGKRVIDGVVDYLTEFHNDKSLYWVAKTDFVETGLIKNYLRKFSLNPSRCEQEMRKKLVGSDVIDYLLERDPIPVVIQE